MALREGLPAGTCVACAVTKGISDSQIRMFTQCNDMLRELE